MIRRLIAGGLGLSSLMLGQKLEFEVASVRPATTMSPGEIQGTSGGPGTRDPERVSFRRASFLMLLLRAFELDADRISGPNWLTTENFDITAKVPPGTTGERFNVMLQNLLVERFGLTYHNGEKDLTVYSLVVAKGGPRIKESVVDANAPPSALRPANPDNFSSGRRVARDQDGFPELPPGNAPAVLGFTDPNGVTSFSARQTPISTLLRNLQKGLPPGSRVIDKTRLTGKYDYRLQFARQPNPAAPGLATPTGGIDAANAAPDVFAAVQAQLGLKLEKGSEPFEILVIDHLDKTPTET